MENCCIIYFGGAKICDVTNLGGAIALLYSLGLHDIYIDIFGHCICSPNTCGYSRFVVLGLD